MSLLSERAFTVHAQASPPDAKRSHRSARLGWVTFWVTQKSHRAKTLIAERFTVEVRFLSRAFLSNTYITFLTYFIDDGFALQKRDFALKTSESHKAILRTLAERGVLVGPQAEASGRAPQGLERGFSVTLIQREQTSKCQRRAQHCRITSSPSPA